MIGTAVPVSGNWRKPAGTAANRLGD